VIELDDLEKNIQRLVNIYGERVKVMDELLRAHLPQAEFKKPHGGYFFWVRLPGVNMPEKRKIIREHQVDIRPGNLFSSQKELNDHMRLSISYYSINDIEQGLIRLKKSILGKE
jgi:DNA-binding transcriptional MocR family regulator